MKIAFFNFLRLLFIEHFFWYFFIFILFLIKFILFLFKYYFFLFISYTIQVIKYFKFFSPLKKFIVKKATYKKTYKLYIDLNLKIFIQNPAFPIKKFSVQLLNFSFHKFVHFFMFDLQNLNSFISLLFFGGFNLG